METPESHPQIGGDPRVASLDAITERLEHIVTPAISAVVEQIDRTEDVRFSPDGTRLALADFSQDRCILLDIRIIQTSDGAPARPTIEITGAMELRSASLNEPHGVEFLDDTTIAVANRRGAVTVFRIPPTTAGAVHNADPICVIDHAGPFHQLRSPGSVRLNGSHGSTVEILVCNNYKRRVTSHRIDMSGGARLRRGRIFLENGLVVPDGISVSPDGAWVAVSNHDSHNVGLYDNRRRLHRSSAPSVTLAGVRYPHGLTFTGDSQTLFVTDAGSPLVHMYDAGPDGWTDQSSPAASIRVLDETTFLKGHKNPREGGPKGLDIDARTQIMAVTCKYQPLAFYFVPELRDLSGRQQFAAHDRAMVGG